MAEESETTPIRIDPKEAQDLWRSQILEARALLDPFHNPPEELIPAMNSGVRMLMQLLPSHRSIKSEQDMTPLRIAIGEFMESSLSFDNMPSGVTAHRGKKDIYFKRKPNSPLPSPQVFPRDIIMVIKRFGLSDGHPQPIEQLAEEFHMHPSPLFDNIKKVAIRANLFPAVSKALSGLRPHPAKKIAYFGTSSDARDLHVMPVAQELGSLPELQKAAVEYLKNDPIPVLKTFFGYTRRVLREMTQLTDEELSSLPHAKKLLEKLGSHTIELAARIEEHFKPGSLTYERGLMDLSTRMRGAQALKALQPKDGDPTFDNVIWGYTRIAHPENHSETMLHFVMGHLIERVANQITFTDGTRIVNKKDDLLRAMGDVIALRETQLGNKSPLHSFYTMWHRPKAEGGLGWI